MKKVYLFLVVSLFCFVNPAYSAWFSAPYIDTVEQSEHTKALHDALGIDAITLNGDSATVTNVADKIVLRDSSGNFGAGIITAGRFDGPVLATTITASGDVNIPAIKFGEGVYIDSAAPHIINVAYGGDTDAQDMWINYFGYQNGTTRFRDFRIADGKNSQLFFVDGSEAKITVSGKLDATELQEGNVKLTGEGSVSVNGAFTSGTIWYAKVGKLVTLHWSSINHASLSAASSVDGLIPAGYRPLNSIQSVTNCDGVQIMRVTIGTGGQFTIHYFDWAGAAFASTNFGSGSITYKQGF